MNSLKATVPVAMKEAASSAASSTGNAVTAGLNLAATKSQELGSKARETIPQIPGKIVQNPGTTPACVVGAVGLAMVAAPAAVAMPALGAYGFGAAGPIAGSMATAAQSAMGSVGAQSAFAIAQSAAMSGYGTTTILGAVQVVGGTVAASAGGALAWARLREGNGAKKEAEEKPKEAAEAGSGKSGKASQSKL